MAKLIRKGGKGSGNWGHAGRPGKVGGSAPRNGGVGSGSSVSGIATETKLLRADKEPDFENLSENGGVFLRDMRQMYDDSGNFEADPEIVDNAIFDDVVATLSNATGVPQDDVIEFVEQMAASSNRYKESNLIQEAAVATFGDALGTNLSDWQKEYFAEDRRLRNKAVNQNLYSDDGKTLHKLLTAMYENTQSQLREWAGEMSWGEEKESEGVFLYRGINIDDDYRVGDVAHLKSNALESWTSDFSVAKRFSNGYRNSVVVRAFVPFSRILSTGYSGFGSFSESEFVVINSDGDDRVKVVYT